MRIINYIIFLVNVLLCVSPQAINANETEKDILPLMSAAEDGIGPLSIPYLRMAPIAGVYVFDGLRPDIFITGNHGKTNHLFLAKWLKSSADGVPVFETPVKIDVDFNPRGIILQEENGKIHGLWIDGKSILHTIFDKEKMQFIKKNTIEVPTRKNIRSIALFPSSKGGYDLIFEVNGLSIPSKYKDQNPNSPSWRPYDEAGINSQSRRYTYFCTAYLHSLESKETEDVHQLSKTDKEIYMGMMQLSNIQHNGKQTLVSGSRRGIFPYYNLLTNKDKVEISKQQYVVGEDKNILYHPSIAPFVCAYTEKGSKNSHLIAAGEGAMYFYKAIEQNKGTEAPMFKTPKPVLQTKAYLDAGSLPSPSVADWDGDGVEDIIVGNSEGFILFYKNIGTNDNPKFLPETRIKAGGKEIQIQAGYSGSVQGTQESRWGYVSPTIVDWNGDGLLDLIVGDITGCYHIYLNKGTKEEPKLEVAHPLFSEGLNLHGVWRCKAAVGKFGDRMALSIVDDEGYIRLYWKIDDYNVEDGGRIELEDGTSILTHIDPAGGTGRCKLDFFDYDQDGRLDLIVGTGRRSAIPNTKTGFPLPTLGKRALGTPLFLKNVTENHESKPILAFPQPFFHPAVGLVHPGGAHETGAVGTKLGGGKKPNLLVGNEEGMLFLLKGDHMRLIDINEASQYRNLRNPFVKK